MPCKSWSTWEAQWGAWDERGPVRDLEAVEATRVLENPSGRSVGLEPCKGPWADSLSLVWFHQGVAGEKRRQSMVRGGPVAEPWGGVTATPGTSKCYAGQNIFDTADSYLKFWVYLVLSCLTVLLLFSNPWHRISKHPRCCTTFSENHRVIPTASYTNGLILNYVKTEFSLKINQIIQITLWQTPMQFNMKTSNYGWRVRKSEVHRVRLYFR